MANGWNMSNCAGCTILFDSEDVSALCAMGSINNQAATGEGTLDVSDCDVSFVGFSCF